MFFCCTMFNKKMKYFIFLTFNFDILSRTFIQEILSTQTFSCYKCYKIPDRCADIRSNLYSIHFKPWMFIFSRLKLYLFCIQESKKNNCTTPQGRQKESIATSIISMFVRCPVFCGWRTVNLPKQFLYDLEVYRRLFHWLFVGEINYPEISL